MQREAEIVEYKSSKPAPYALRVLGRLILSLPPAWLIIACFMAFADVRLPWLELVVLVTFGVLWVSILTLVFSVVEWLLPDGNAGPLLLHLAAAVVVLIAISHIASLPARTG